MHFYLVILYFQRHEIILFVFLANIEDCIALQNSVYRWWWFHADYECGGDVGFETFTRELMEAVSTVTISDNKRIFFSIQHAMAIAVAA